LGVGMARKAFRVLGGNTPLAKWRAEPAHDRLPSCFVANLCELHTAATAAYRALVQMVVS
jgi:hypothetical protein